MQITFNTEDLSDVDKAVLAVLAGGAAPAAAPAAKPAATPAKAKAAPAKAKAEEPVEEPEDAAEDAAEEDTEEAGGATLEEAVALATKMVSNGEAAKVKKALGTVGAKKVSEIPEDKVDAFIAELS